MNTDPITFAQSVVVNITAELNGLKAGNARLIVERDKALEACATEKQRADQEEIAAARYAKTIFDLRAQLTEAQEQRDQLQRRCSELNGIRIRVVEERDAAEQQVRTLREALDVLFVPYRESCERYHGKPSGVYVQRFRFENAEATLATPLTSQTDTI